MKTTNNFVAAKQAIKLLGISYPTFNRWAVEMPMDKNKPLNAKQIPYVWIGGTRCVPTSYFLALGIPKEQVNG